MLTKPRYKIAHNIPLPHKSRAGKWENIISRTKKGDSVLFPNESIARAFGRALHYIGKKSARRSLGNGKVRVWRLS